MPSEVTANFLDGFGLALSLDGTPKTITFSDGSGTRDGRTTKTLNVLWLTDQERIIRTSSAGLNLAAWNQGITLILRASEVPRGAAIAANAYLTVDDHQYRVDRAVVENGILQVDLATFRTSNK